MPLPHNRLSFRFIFEGEAPPEDSPLLQEWLPVEPGAVVPFRSDGGVTTPEKLPPGTTIYVARLRITNPNATSYIQTIDPLATPLGIILDVSFTAAKVVIPAAVGGVPSTVDAQVTFKFADTSAAAAEVSGSIGLQPESNV